ncbi:MAG: SIMPL domain-containing protein, partial [Stenotrophobium sp.]
IAAFLIGLGVATGGWGVGQGLRHLNAANRAVSVKGLAEREVPADLVIWPISYVEAGNDLSALYQRIEHNNQVLREFLAVNKLGGAETVLAPPQITDAAANNDSWGNNSGKANYRYRAEVKLTVRSSDVAAVKLAMQHSGELIKQGVAVAMNYDAKPEYLFTKLNDIKPALIAEATQNARRAAEQFAKDSSSRVGGIRSANQGQITISDRDPGTPEVKVVRVVSTVDYSLVGD